MTWWDINTSLYKCLADNYGRPASYGDIFFTQFAMDHDWFYKDPSAKKWITGNSNDLHSIVKLRAMNPEDSIYQQTKVVLKQTMQCYTPSALYRSKKKDKEVLIHINPILQLDFDNVAEYDIDEVRKAIFELPYTCFVGKSVSGNGLFALILIDEPERLRAYAEHCFIIFDKYGLPVDTTKGRNYTDLRFVSYDSNMLYRDDPKPLHIKRFNTPKIQPSRTTVKTFTSSNGLLKWAIEQIRNAQVGQRFETVRKTSYTMGGHGHGLEEIKEAINNCSQYAGVEPKYLNHACECYEAGSLKPITSKN